MLVDLALWDDEVERAILNSRGWVAQERFSAPRTLHFTSQQLFWECRKTTACETADDIDPRERYLRPCAHLREALSRINTRSSMESEATLLSTAVRCWWGFVGSYSNCQLSKEEDMLVAISGIAKEVQRVMNDEYMAGMWKRTFVSDLLWHNSWKRKSNSEPVLRT